MPMWGKVFVPSLLFFFFKIFGILLMVSGGSVFFYWLSMELCSISVLAFLKYEESIPETPLVMYFVSSAVGGFLFLWGMMSGGLEILSSVGLMMKLGIFPPFFWFPKFVSSISFFSFFMFSTLLKVPYMVLYEVFFEFSGFFMCVLVFSSFWSLLSMFKKMQNMKSVVGWSSILDTFFFLMCFIGKFYEGMFFFFFYSLFLFFFCFFLSGFSEVKFLGLGSGGSGKVDLVYLTLIFLSVLILSGVPPFFPFFVKMKVFFFVSSMLSFSSVFLVIFLVLVILVMFFQSLFYVKYASKIWSEFPNFQVSKVSQVAPWLLGVSFVNMVFFFLLV